MYKLFAIIIILYNSYSNANTISLEHLVNTMSPQEAAHTLATLYQGIPKTNFYEYQYVAPKLEQPIKLAEIIWDKSTWTTTTDKLKHPKTSNNSIIPDSTQRTQHKINSLSNIHRYHQRFPIQQQKPQETALSFITAFNSFFTTTINNTCPEITSTPLTNETLYSLDILATSHFETYGFADFCQEYITLPNKHVTLAQNAYSKEKEFAESTISQELGSQAIQCYLKALKTTSNFLWHNLLNSFNEYKLTHHDICLIASESDPSNEIIETINLLKQVYKIAQQ